MRTVVLGLLLLSTAPVLASPQVAAVVDLKFGADVPATARSTLRAAVDEALERAGLGLVSRTEIDYAQRSAKDLFDCILKPQCRVEIGRRLNASLLLSGSISYEDGAWEASLALFDVDVGAVGSEDQRVCPRCAVPAFARSLTELVGLLVRNDRQRPRGTLVVRTRPPGVQVQIDERPVGASDLELEVFAGTHTLALGEALSTAVEVQPKQRKEVDFKVPSAAPTTAAAAPPPVPTNAPLLPETRKEDGQRRAPPMWLLGVAIAADAVGIGMVGFGARFLYDDGRGTCDLMAPQRQCPQVADTFNAGVALTVVGGVLVAGGTGLLVYDLVARKRSRRVAVAPIIGRETMGLSVGGGF